MKKTILLSLGILYAGVSLGSVTYDAPNFLALDWNKITPSYVPSDPAGLTCEKQTQFYICTLLKPTYTMGYIYFTSKTNPNKYCTYYVEGLYDESSLSYKYSTGLVTAQEMKCQKHLTPNNIWQISE